MSQSQQSINESKCQCVRDGDECVYQCYRCWNAELNARMAARRGSAVTVEGVAGRDGAAGVQAGGSGRGGGRSVRATDAAADSADEGDWTADGHDNGSADESGNEYEAESGDDDKDLGEPLPPFGSPQELKARAGTQVLTQARYDDLRELSRMYRDRERRQARGRVHDGGRPAVRNRSASPVPRHREVVVIGSDDDDDMAPARVLPDMGQRERQRVGVGAGGHQAGAGGEQHMAPAAVGADDVPDGLQQLAEPEGERVAGSRGRSYVFTLNLGLELTDRQAVAKAEEVYGSFQAHDAKIEKFVMQLERGGANARPHLQGWVYMANPCTFKAVHALFPRGTQPWIRKARGTPQQCWEYCTKEDTKVHGPWSKGAKPDGQGKRNDIKEFAQAARGLGDGSVTVRQLQEDYKSVEARYMKYFDRVVAREQPVRTELTRCTLVTGPPATGKTKKIMQITEQLGYDFKTEVYYLPVRENDKANQWWDRYEGQPVVVIEDAEPGFMSRAYFLRLIDAVPLQVQTKGAHVNFLAKHVFISSNYTEEDLWPFYGDAVERRLHTIWRTDYAAGFRYRVDTRDASVSASHAVWSRAK